MRGRATAGRPYGPSPALRAPSPKGRGVNTSWLLAHGANTMMHRPSLAKAILAGLIATLIMVLLGFMATYVGTPWLNWGSTLGKAFGDNPTAGYLLLFAVGMLLAVLYVNVLRDRLPGTSWKRGLFFASLLWVLTGAFLAPLLSLGFFMGGVVIALGTLASYLVYGAILGFIYDTRL